MTSVQKILTAATLTTALAFSTVTNASWYGEISTTCQTIKNGKSTSKGSCKVGVGGGAGGIVTIIDYKNKKYKFVDESAFEGSIDDTKFMLYRDAKSLKKLSQSVGASRVVDKKLSQQTLTCYKKPNMAQEICYIDKME